MADAFLLIIRWIHAVAAFAWIGGGIFYWVVLRPANNAGHLPPPLARFAGNEFNQLVGLAMWALVITGGILMFTRLSEPTATLPYGVVLGVKIALSAWMFFLVLGRKGRRERQEQGRLRSAVNALGHINMTVILGLAIVLLSDALRMIVERELG